MRCFLAETTTHDTIFIFDVAIKQQNFPLPPRICKGSKHKKYQRNLWGVDKRKFLSIFIWPLPWPIPCKGVQIRPQLPLHEVNGVNSAREKCNRFRYDRLRSSYCVQLTQILTSEGHVFDHAGTRISLTWQLTWSIFPNSLTSMVLRNKTWLHTREFSKLFSISGSTPFYSICICERGNVRLKDPSFDIFSLRQ